jgi:hypothetical protein
MPVGREIGDRAMATPIDQKKPADQKPVVDMPRSAVPASERILKDANGNVN